MEVGKKITKDNHSLNGLWKRPAEKAVRFIITHSRLCAAVVAGSKD